MSERLADVEARIGTVHQLSAVVGAMRGIAAARARDARARLDGIRAHAAIIADAIGRALAFLPAAERAGARPTGRDGHVVVALCAEQGFAGAFSERVLDAAARLVGGGVGEPGELFVLGDRGLLVAEERGLAVAWSAPMIAHGDGATALANRIVEALYRRLEHGLIARVDVVHAAPAGTNDLSVVEKRLIPFDFDRFPAAPRAIAPRLTLPPNVLLARLGDEYVFAETCEAVVLSYAAENEARMRAMIAAKTSVTETLDGLVGQARRLRQDEITNEIVELASGALDR